MARIHVNKRIGTQNKQQSTQPNGRDRSASLVSASTNIPQTVVSKHVIFQNTAKTIKYKFSLYLSKYEQYVE